MVSLCAVSKAFNPDKLSVASEQTNSTGSRMTFLRASVVTGVPLVIPFEIEDELCGSPSCKNHEFSHHSVTCVSKLGYTQKGYLGSFQKGIFFSHLQKLFGIPIFETLLISVVCGSDSVDPRQEEKAKEPEPEEPKELEEDAKPLTGPKVDRVFFFFFLRFNW